MKLGRYEVVRELGKGAMGIVYLAKDPLIGRLVALKTIRPATGADDDETREFQQRFVREAQAAGILNHPSIVTVHDIGRDESTGVSFIAMEYVEGQNLKEILAQGRPLTFDDIGDIIAQVADALDFAHSKGIVHRDVKPANVILLDGNRAKIMDFGIAKIASGAANLTSTGQFLGTPNYMAPEQIKGAPVDGRTDIFSLGICLYECLTRRKPFGGDSLTSISYKIVHEPFPPLHDINPQIPEGYGDVVAMCLAKDPSKRYQRAKDMATALRAVLRGERPAKAEPVSVEDTVVTRDRDSLPTVDVPLPAGAAARAGVSTVAVPASKSARISGSTGARRIKEQVNETISRVARYPGWRARISPALAGTVVGLVILGLAGAVLAIQRQKPVVPKIDSRLEQRLARERQLREQGNALLQQGKIHEAYEKFDQLYKMAPNSPAVADVVQKLDAIRQKEELNKQQLADAKTKRDQGIALFNQKNYPEAIKVLQDSFNLNPADDITVNYLKLAQTQQAIIDATQLARSASARNATTTAGGGSPIANAANPARAAVPANAPAQLTTIFDSPFSDGYILVRIGMDTVAHENLFEEKGRFFKRVVPKVVNATSQFPAKNADLDVWVVVPSQNINAHAKIKHNFQPGSVQKLLVSYNAQSKVFNYQLN